MPQKSRKRTRLNRPEIVRQFGRRVREARSARGLKQHELAAVAGMSVAYAARVENGQTECGIGLAERIATALELPLRDLLPGGQPESKKLTPEIARKRLESVLAKGDDQTLALAAALLTLIEESAGRRRRKS